MKWYLGSFITYGVMIYILGAMCAWNLNPENWNEIGRSFAAIFWMLISLYIGCEINKDEKGKK